VSDHSTVRDPKWLYQHVRGILNFYYPTCLDHRFGGYVPQMSDRDGHVYDGLHKSVVATARFVYNFSVGELLDGPDWCRSVAHHGVDFLLDAHRRADGGYPWLLAGREVEDSARTCYAHAFVLLAFATAAKAGVPRARDHVAETADCIDERFWESDHGLCRGKLDADWHPTERYRGQNANMHVCEAMLAAHEATGEERYLDRAATIAERLARDLADAGDGLVWEHYTADWEFDWEYNRDQPEHLFRPWGYQPGHLLEWAKLLVRLDGHRERGWHLDRARRFFDAAVEQGWDADGGGFVYTVDREGDPVVEDKYYWPLAEGFAAAARLAAVTDEDRYREWYDRIWAYAWEHVINRRYGNWYGRLTPDNRLHDGIDATPKVKTDYHPVGCCYDVLRALGGDGRP
jgi:mannose/cellobiose epimerase-like protein (N-acyl-D-glucosamine 2-epimerase family)